MNTTQKEKTRREAESLTTNLLVGGDNVKQFLNNLTASFAMSQRPRQACGCGGIFVTVCTDDGGENECYSTCNGCGEVR